jgi:hypothetical protein
MWFGDFWSSNKCRIKGEVPEMAELIITVAAKLVGVTRAKLYEMIEAEEIMTCSPQGSTPLIDSDELIRVFGPLPALTELDKSENPRTRKKKPR